LQPAEEQEANIRGARAAAKYCNQIFSEIFLQQTGFTCLFAWL
jgi:hypothetical protein